MGKTIKIEFPDHVQLHTENADGNVTVRTMKKNETSVAMQIKPETQQPTQSV